MPTTSRVDGTLDDAQEGLIDAHQAVREIATLTRRIERLARIASAGHAQTDRGLRDLRAMELRAKTGPRRAMAETAGAAA